MSTETKNNQNLIERLFSVGAHFGFSKSRRHPSVTPYLYGNKMGTDIFDLEKTSALLENAKTALTEAGKRGENVLFVGTKEETSRLVKAAAEKAEASYVVNRWIGGLMTNFSEIRKRIARLLDLTAQFESGELERKYTKKERVIIGRELDKLNFNFGGIKTLDRAPRMMVIVDPRHDAIAVREARDLKIPIIAVTSSDGNIANITYPVVVNDSLKSSVTFILDELVDAYLTGKKEYTPAPRRENERRPRA